MSATGRSLRSTVPHSLNPAKVSDDFATRWAALSTLVILHMLSIEVARLRFPAGMSGSGGPTSSTRLTGKMLPPSKRPHRSNLVRDRLGRQAA